MLNYMFINYMLNYMFITTMLTICSFVNGNHMVIVILTFKSDRRQVLRKYLTSLWGSPRSTGTFEVLNHQGISCNRHSIHKCLEFSMPRSVGHGKRRCAWPPNRTKGSNVLNPMSESPRFREITEMHLKPKIITFWWLEFH